MNYIVTRQGRNGETLFLVDRKITRSKWWTTMLLEAMSFRLRSAAEYSASRLRFGNPEVVTLKQAMMYERENEHIIANLEDNDHLLDCGTR